MDCTRTHTQHTYAKLMACRAHTEHTHTHTLRCTCKSHMQAFTVAVKIEIVSLCEFFGMFFFFHSVRCLLECNDEPVYTRRNPLAMRKKRDNDWNQKTWLNAFPSSKWMFCFLFIRFHDKFNVWYTNLVFRFTLNGTHTTQYSWINLTDNKMSLVFN